MTTGQHVKLERHDYFKPPAGSEHTRYVLDGTSTSRTTATITLPPRTGIYAGWNLFWRSLWWTIRRRKAIAFWMDSDS